MFNVRSTVTVRSERNTSHQITDDSLISQLEGPDSLPGTGEHSHQITGDSLISQIEGTDSLSGTVVQ